MSASMLGASPRASRRTLMKGAAWTVPALTIAAAAPVLAASTSRIRSGLFISLVGDSGGVGSSAVSTVYPQYPATDYRWSDNDRVSSSNSAINGEGVFTPGGTIGDAADTTSTGIWLSVPMDAAGNAIPGSSVTLKKGATFALDFQIQLSYVATDRRVKNPTAATIDGQPHILQNFNLTGTQSTNTASNSVRATTSGVPMSYKRESYWWSQAGYDGQQGNTVINISLRYTTTQDLTLDASSGKLYTQLLFFAPAYRVYYPNMKYLGLRLRPLTGIVASTANGVTIEEALTSLDGMQPNTSIMGAPGTTVPVNFPNWNISGVGSGGSSGNWVA